MSLNRRITDLEEKRSARSPARFWGPPRTDEERRARIEAGLTPAENPQCFWTPFTDPDQAHEPRQPDQ